ncbi:hypothetical protein D9M73_109610 [compost metagenome]
MHREGGNRAAEKVGQLGVGKRGRSGTRAQRESFALPQVLNSRHGHITGLQAGDDVALVALMELAQFLQADLRVDLVIFAQDLDLAAGDCVADLVEVQLHAVQVAIGQCRKHLREGVEYPYLQRRIGFGEDGRGNAPQDGGTKGACASDECAARTAAVQ